MKNLFKVNRVLIITNIVLGLTIYLGLLFLIPLGIAQVIMSVIIYNNLKQYNQQIKNQFIIYVSITSIILIGIVLSSLDVIDIKYFFIHGMTISIIMAFLHLNITYLIFKTSTNQNHSIN